MAKRKFTTLIATILILALGAAIWAISVMAHGQAVQAETEKSREKLLSIVRTASLHLDTRAFARVRAEYLAGADFPGKSRSFAAIKKQLQEIIGAHQTLGFNKNNVYTFFTMPQTDNVFWAVMTHDKNFTGELYRPTPMMNKVAKGQARFATTDVYLSAASHRRWVSAYAGIVHQGKTIGILEVAWEIDHVLAEAQQSIKQYNYIIGAIILLAVTVAVILLYFARRLDSTRLLLQLESERARTLQDERHQGLFFDKETGLPNKAHLLSVLENRIAIKHNLPGRGLSLVLIGICRFRALQARYKAKTLSMFIQALANGLESSLHNDEFLARLDNQTFAIVIRKNINAAALESRTTQWLDQTSQPIPIENHSMQVDTRIGICELLPRHISAADLVGDAQVALGLAESLSNRRLAYFEAQMQSELASVAQLESEMRAALEGQQFSVAFQPIYYLADQSCQKFEALARWQHAERGAISPALFIPIAEESQLIHPLQQQILEQVCGQLNKSANADLTISVNISALQFQQNGFSENLLRQLQEAGISTAQIELEITETLAMEDINLTRIVLEELKGAGLRIAIDDFGVGHSSFRYLAELPFDVIKIDRSFLMLGEKDKRGNQIIETMISLAHNMQKEVVMEGIETEEQLNLLTGLGCDYGQGFFLGRPGPLLKQ